jgi:hypothetical protein
MNDEHKLWQPSNMQIDAMEAAEGKIPPVHSSEVETIALPVASAPAWISVLDRLPEANQLMMGTVFEAIHPLQPHNMWVEHFDPEEPVGRMTHWFAIPALEAGSAQIETLKPNEQNILPHLVITHKDENGTCFKVVKQIGMDYFSRPVAEIAADKLNMLRG